MSTITNHPDDFRRGVDYIGITVSFHCNDGKGNILLHKRSANCRDEVGTWDPGGGALEFGELPEDAVRREVLEEYGCEVLSMKLGGVRNIFRDNNGTPTHWIAFVYSVRVDPEKVKIGDPEKMDDIGWFSLDSLPTPIHSQLLLSFEYLKELHYASAD